MRPLCLSALVLAASLTATHTFKLPFAPRKLGLAQPNVAEERGWDLGKAAKAALVSAGMSLALISPAGADNELAEVGVCLLRSCPGALSKCLFDVKCAANIACLNNCGSKSGLDKTACQIRCGDQLEDEVVAEFNKCAVSEKRCVPQVKDNGQYPALPASATVQDFDTRLLKGRWYISAGLNRLFDTFDCQVHFFTAPSSNELTGSLTWRITEPDGEYFTRTAVQMFKKDKSNGGLLLNHDNEYLHYEDDWYVLDYEPKEFVLVYYRGSNDAWIGYGGAVVYTKSPTLNPELIPRIEEACKKANIDWKDFKQVDNSCKQLDPKSAEALRVKFAERLLKNQEDGVSSSLTTLRGTLAGVVQSDIKGVEKAIAGLAEVIEEDESEVAQAVQGVLTSFEKEIEMERMKLAAKKKGNTIKTTVWNKMEGDRLDRLTNKMSEKGPVEKGAKEAAGAVANEVNKLL